MMKREDFIFTVGFQGYDPIVDKKAQNTHGKKNTEELLKEGLWKPAFCSATYQDNTAEMEKVLEQYNKENPRTYDSIEDLKRLFGVFSVPELKGKVKKL